MTNRVLSHSQFTPEIVHHELQGKDCTCPDCHGQLKEIGSTVQRQELVFIPAQLKRIDHVQRPHYSPEIQSEGAQLPSGRGLAQAWLAHQSEGNSQLAHQV